MFLTRLPGRDAASPVVLATVSEVVMLPIFIGKNDYVTAVAFSVVYAVAMVCWYLGTRESRTPVP